MTNDNEPPAYGYFLAWPIGANGPATSMHGRAREGIAQGVFPSSVLWILVSLGPDKIQNVDTGGSPPSLTMPYDSTNGTRSSGDIYRSGP